MLTNGHDLAACTARHAAIRAMNAHELNAEICHARNRRDAYAPGREPYEVNANLVDLLAEQRNRRINRNR